MTVRLVSVINGLPTHDVPVGQYQCVNPTRTDEVVADVALAASATFSTACGTAATVQQQWAAMPPPNRGRAVANLGRMVAANKDGLADMITHEVGKPRQESLGEVQEVIDTCDFFLGEGRRLYGQTIPSEMPDKQLFTFRDPLGVVAVITAGNFPVAVPSWYLVPALLCGNAVVWKPAEYAAATANAFFELIVRSGFPAGVVNLIFADGEHTYLGLELALQAGTVHKVGFTGSTTVGSRIGELCGRFLQSPCLELGGKNPMVIMPDADLDLAVQGAMFSGFGTAGQRCTSLGTVIVHRSVHGPFLNRLTEAVNNAAIGDPRADVLYGPMLAPRFAERFDKYLSWISSDHQIYGSTGIGRITSDNPRKGFVGGNPEGGLFYHPVIVDGVKETEELFTEEIFGPMIGVTTFDNIHEAIRLANKPGYGLSASIYTNDPSAVFAFRRGSSAGMISVNNSTSGAEAHIPFGGNGRSGNGSRLSGRWVLDQFTRWQSMNWDYSGHLQKAQMDVPDIVADFDFRLS